MATIIQFIEQSGTYLSYGVAGLYVIAGFSIVVVRIAMLIGVLNKARQGALGDFLANFQ
jgi:hypothetical protein